MASALVLGAGQVGTFVAEALARHGFDTLTADIAPSEGFYKRFGPKNGRDVEVCDLIDPGSVEKLLRKSSWDLVVCAVGIVGAACEKNPKKAEIANVMIPTKVAAMLQGCSDVLFLHISSVSVYGRCRSMFISESAKKAPRSMYGQSKARAEELVIGLTDLKRCIVRPCGVFGPVRFGSGSHSARLIETALTRAKMHGAVELRGPSAGGDEYLYVRDLAEAVARIATTLPAREVEIVNVGTGHRTGVHALADALRTVVPSAAVTVVEVPGAYESLPPLDIRHLGALCGFEPRFTLVEGLRDYLYELGGA